MERMFLKSELEGRDDLLPVFKGNDAVLYMNPENPYFCGNYEKVIKDLRKSTEPKIDIYQLCRLSTSLNGVPSFFAITDFKETRTGWETSLHKAAKADRTRIYQTFREKNLPFLRMYMMGSQSAYIVCPITNQLIDSWEMSSGSPVNVWEQHHFKVRNRVSIQKESSDPGEILRRIDFSIPSGDTVNAIKDMMRTIFLSPTAHKGVHNTWKNSDISNYERYQRPWSLQLQDNWDEWMKFLESYGYSASLFGQFDDWISSLRLTIEEMS